MFPEVRKHRAPKGAFRHLRPVVERERKRRVRKHRAPNGALILREEELLEGRVDQSESTERQKVH